MSSTGDTDATQSKRRPMHLLWLVAGVIVVAGGLVAIYRGGDPFPATGIDTAEQPFTEPGQLLPSLTFASEIRTAHPEVGTFLDEFLNTCLVGDYAGYRRLVSRAYAPESRERFEAIYRATQAVTVDSIELIDIPEIQAPVYRVVSTVEFSPQQQAKLREPRREVAILVFKEGDNWRMAPAPTELQPRDEPVAATTSAPTTSAPAYPWDEDGDY
jgi:hypothetical protein